MTQFSKKSEAQLVKTFAQTKKLKLFPSILGQNDKKTEKNHKNKFFTCLKFLLKLNFDNRPTIIINNIFDFINLLKVVAFFEFVFTPQRKSILTKLPFLVYPQFYLLF